MIDKSIFERNPNINFGGVELEIQQFNEEEEFTLPEKIEDYFYDAYCKKFNIENERHKPLSIEKLRELLRP